MKVYVVAKQGCCDGPMEILGAYYDETEAQDVAEEGNLDPDTCGSVGVYATLVLGHPSD